MSLDDAIKKVQSLISGASPSAVIKIVKMTDDKTRITVLPPAGEMQAIKDELFMPCMDLLNNENVDIQVLVYDKDAQPLQG